MILSGNGRLRRQAKEAVFDSTTVDITSSNGYVFETQGSVIKFDGFLAIMGRDTDEVIIPPVAVGDTCNAYEVSTSATFYQSAAAVYRGKSGENS